MACELCSCNTQTGWLVLPVELFTDGSRTVVRIKMLRCNVRGTVPGITKKTLDVKSRSWILLRYELFGSCLVMIDDDQTVTTSWCRTAGESLFSVKKVYQCHSGQKERRGWVHWQWRWWFHLRGISCWKRPEPTARSRWTLKAAEKEQASNSPV